MSRDEIIAIATEAGLNSYRIAPGEAVAVWERFAALVAAQGREACAQAREIEGLRKDAERYRTFIDCGQPICFLGYEYFGKEALDAAIDATKGEPHG